MSILRLLNPYHKAILQILYGVSSLPHVHYNIKSQELQKLLQQQKPLLYLHRYIPFMVLRFFAYMKHFADMMKGNTDLYIFLYALINNCFSKLKTLSLTFSLFRFKCFCIVAIFTQKLFHNKTLLENQIPLN